MFVLDTSAFINGWNDHYDPETFPAVWDYLATQLDGGTLISPRESFEEIKRQDDSLVEWAGEHEDAFIYPSEEVGRLAGEIQSQFPRPGERNAADPFVIAEAKIRSFTVVTYEGRSFDGRKTKNWPKRMPGVCVNFGVGCCTLPEVFRELGARF